jgi:hypothetical protein
LVGDQAVRHQLRGSTVLPASCTIRFPALEGDQQLVWAFDFIFGLQEFLTPWLAGALGALVDHVSNSETVIAGSFGAGARELLTCLAGLEELAFERSVLTP